MRLLWRLLGWLFTRAGKFGSLCARHYWLGRFKKAGSNVTIGSCFACHGPDHIRVAEDVVIADRVTLRALQSYPWSQPPQHFQPELDIQRGCFINHGVHISCTHRITLGKDVMIADHCFIADNNHGYEDTALSIKAQPLKSGAGLTIGDETWIGANTCIAGSFTIGKHCVIGANSVVTSDLPDYCVAAGAPARIIKRYDPGARTWVKQG